jgi:hypothetical protein
MKELRELERSNAIASASAEHEAAEERLTSLRGILSTRNREAYDWQAAWGSLGPYQPSGFRAPTLTFSQSHSEAAVAKQLPITGWIVLYTACAVLATFLGNTTSRLLTIPFLAVVVFWLVSTLRMRAALARTDFQNKSLEFATDLLRLTSDHATAQDKAHAEWSQTEAARKKVSRAIDDSDLPTIVSVLESELQNESLPVPLVFELELDNREEVKLEVTLPDLDDVPAQVTSITQRGKLSTKAMGQRDRTDLFADLCAALCLRLVYEAFRVVPSLIRIEAFGSTSGIDPATGHPREFIALHLVTTRAAIAALDLDNVDPGSALSALGGNLSCDRRGVLSALEGVAGITGHPR